MLKSLTDVMSKKTLYTLLLLLLLLKKRERETALMFCMSMYSITQSNLRFKVITSTER